MAIKELYYERKIDNTGRLVIPIPVRQQYGITAGDTLRFVATEGGILLVPVKKKIR